MKDFSELDLESLLFDTPIGKKKIDLEGSPVSGVRMEVSKAYAGIPVLLQKVIDQNDQNAWQEITNKIDYIYSNLDFSLGSLDKETGFGKEVQSQIKHGKRLLFKPNIVAPLVIDPTTHGEGSAAIIATEWSLIAALMRWFHDKLNIHYYQMALGEASTSTFLVAELFGKTFGQTMTTEALFEGKSFDIYGGWGFYFVRKYLADRHPSSHQDDPMKGFENSVTGNYLPPGQAKDKLMVYDLNKIHNDPSRGRTVVVPDGANFKEITLHKVIIGGDPDNVEDLRNYPGCVLVNVPKHKIHAQDLLTNAIKNLGIGLYPTLCAFEGDKNAETWKYSYPAQTLPTYKGKLPHCPWMLKIDEKTNLPMKDKNGEYIAIKTAGMPGTQSDIIRAVQSQKVFMVHVSDAIDMVNISHNPDGKAVRIPEGFVWSSLDCVALDFFCARYCFKTIPMAEALKLKEENGWPTEFVHQVPLAQLEGNNIITIEGFDSPLFRYNLYRYAEKRGVGQQKYYVIGWDSLTESPLVSLNGHLGRIENSNFYEMITKTLYYNPNTILYDLQKTILSYIQANDSLTGSKLYKDLMETFDENHDGVIDYDEMGRKGVETTQFSNLATALDIQIKEKYGQLKGGFMESIYFLKYSDRNWNEQKHDFTKEKLPGFMASVAFDLSRMDNENEDLFVKGMTYGRGKWPSWQMLKYLFENMYLYGSLSLDDASPWSIYGKAFQYADKAFNSGGYTGSRDEGATDPNALTKYYAALSKGAKPLQFTFYVPVDYGKLNNHPIPNVKETTDPQKIFTAHFNGGQEVW